MPATPLVTLKSNKLPILCYHKVGMASALGRRLTVNPSRLETHIRFFRRRGYTFVTAQAIEKTWPPRAVAFTFDDGFEDALELGGGLLRKHGGLGTFYVVPGLVGGLSNWEGEQPYSLADWDALSRANAAGHEIGNHTLTHARLADLTVEAQRKEIAEAFEEMRSHNLEPRSFCYPFGSYTPETVAILQELGVIVAVTTRKGVARSHHPRLELPRVFLSYGNGLPRLLYKVFLRHRLKTNPIPPGIGRLQPQYWSSWAGLPAESVSNCRKNSSTVAARLSS